MIILATKTSTCMKRSLSAVKVIRSFMHLFVADEVSGTVLDDRIEEFAELIREHYDITELGDPASSTDVCSLCLQLCFVT
jgi:DNA polymerase alpha subunit B N-terminal